MANNHFSIIAFKFIEQELNLICIVLFQVEEDTFHCKIAVVNRLTDVDSQISYAVSKGTFISASATLHLLRDKHTIICNRDLWSTFDEFLISQ